MTAIPSPLSYVYDGTRCLGFILKRGKLGFEALDRGEMTLGIFPTSAAAAKAVFDSFDKEHETYETRSDIS